jgi:hypothetical protein
MPMVMRRRTWILLVAVPVLLVAGLLLVAQLANYRAAQDYVHRLKREAQGPWPKETVAQAVVVTLGFSAQSSATAPADLATLGGHLREVLAKAGVGQFDGTECLHGRCALFMYGPDADKVFDAVKPVLRQEPVTSGASVELRLGPADAWPVTIRKVTL